MDEPGRHSAKENKANTEKGKKKTCVISLSKKVKQRVEWWLPGQGVWGNRTWPKGTKLQLFSMNKSRALIHSMGTTVYNAGSNTGNLLREQILGALITKNNKYVRHNVFQFECGNYFIMQMYMKSSCHTS